MSSEVARIRQLIDQEYEAMRCGLTGLASGTARHDFIQHKYDAIGECAQALFPLVGEEAAWNIVLDIQDTSITKQQPSASS